MQIAEFLLQTSENVRVKTGFEWLTIVIYPPSFCLLNYYKLDENSSSTGRF